MSAAFAEPGLVERVLIWIFGARPTAKPVEVCRSREAAFVVPMLFTSRASPSWESGEGATDFVAITRAGAWGLAARLRSVMATNVPKGLKRWKRNCVSPAGKAMPKKPPRVLKSYKSGSGVPAQAPWRREKQTPVRRSNVVTLPVSKPRTLQKGRSDRLAA